MPKQAHMADLQAAAAARNLVGEFNGTQMDAGFKVELICIVDSIRWGPSRLELYSRLVVLTE